MMSESFADKDSAANRRGHNSAKPKCCLIKKSHASSDASASTNRQVAEIKTTEVSDVYRAVLGPTTDETILAALQTIMEMCTRTKKTTTMPESPSDLSETETNYSGFSEDQDDFAFNPDNMSTGHPTKIVTTTFKCPVSERTKVTSYFY